MNAFSYNFHIFIRLETFLLMTSVTQCSFVCQSVELDYVRVCWPTEFSKASDVSSAGTLSTIARQFFLDI
jgi:hypothetical protein